MKLKTMTFITAILGSIVAGPVLAADADTAYGNHVERRGDRIERHLNKQGDRINHRLDRRSAYASANGHDKRAVRLTRKGNRINHRLDRAGRRVDYRTDRFASRY